MLIDSVNDNETSRIRKYWNRCVKFMRYHHSLYIKRNVRNSNFYLFLKEITYMILLGCLMAFLSLGIDFASSKCLIARNRFYESSKLIGLPASFFSWTGFIVAFFLLSATVINFLSYRAAGSGIPEVKVILQGATIEGIFTFRTLIAKIFGLILASSTGMPVGREGPYIHIACILALFLYRFVYEPSKKINRPKREFLVIACAVGVACCFSSPIGGVLYSIETTSTFFAVKNYWRGFFCAITAALIMKLLDGYFYGYEKVTSFLKSNVIYNLYLYPKELLLFIGLGVLCGILSIIFIQIYKCYMMFASSRFIKPLTKRWWLYTIIIAFIVGSISFPGGIGYFYGSKMTQLELLKFIFYNNTETRRDGSFSFYLNFLDLSTTTRAAGANKTFTRSSPTNYVTHGGLSILILVQVFTTILIASLPIPIGTFVPVLTLGAAVGKLYGDLVRTLFYDNFKLHYPYILTTSGTYAMIGAAAFSGSVTRTISTSVIIFELTGELTYLMPNVISVIVANAVAHCFVPSIYTVIIKYRKLPYLPDISVRYQKLLRLIARDAIKSVNHLPCITCDTTFSDLEIYLIDNPNLYEFPVTKNPADFALETCVTEENVRKYLSDEINVKKWMSRSLNHLPNFNNYATIPKVLTIKNTDERYEDWKRSKMSDKINLKLLLSSNKCSIIQISPSMPFIQLYELLTTGNIHTLYVTANSILLGTISYNELSDLINNYNTFHIF